MSSAYQLALSYPLPDEDPMESDLELTPTPRKPPTEWWVCDDLLEMLGKQVEAVRKQRKYDWVEAQIDGGIHSLRMEIKMVKDILDKKNRPFNPRTVRYKYVRKAVENRSQIW